MTIGTFLRIACLIGLGIAAPVSAKYDAERDFRQVKSAESLQLRADRAYLLLRIDTTRLNFGPAILRVPTRQEVDDYEIVKKEAHAKAGKKAGPLESFSFDYQGRPNLFLILPKVSIAAAGKIKTVLVEVSPGDYVLYGIGGVYECFCLGTVGFSAQSGQITDLGTMITDWAWQPSVYLELSGEVDLGPSADIDYGLFATAMRPKRSSDSMPVGLDTSKVKSASYRAVGPFLEPSTNLINRLAPMPGVLAYDQGRVIDVITGKEAPSNMP
jgi:hypothetical protein